MVRVSVVVIASEDQQDVRIWMKKKVDVLLTIQNNNDNKITWL